LADGLRQMTFARAAGAEKQSIFPLGDEGARGQIEDQTAVDLGIEGEIEIVQRQRSVHTKAEVKGRQTNVSYAARGHKKHTFGTWLRQQGVELDVIASQLGHHDLGMTKRYARIASDQVRQAVNGLDSMLGTGQEVRTSDSIRTATKMPRLAEASSATH
jgi:site-specific recombinase XerC